MSQPPIDPYAFLQQHGQTQNRVLTPVQLQQLARQQASSPMQPNNVLQQQQQQAQPNNPMQLLMQMQMQQQQHQQQHQQQQQQQVSMFANQPAQSQFMPGLASGLAQQPQPSQMAQTGLPSGPTQMNMATLASLVQKGQLPPEQYHNFLQNLQRAQAQAQAQNQQQAQQQGQMQAAHRTTPHPPQQQQPHLMQQQQQQQPQQQQQMQQPPPMQQQRQMSYYPQQTTASQPQQNSLTPAAAGASNVRLPIEIVKNYLANMHAARNLQQKHEALKRQLESNIMPDGSPIRPEQRAEMERQIGEAQQHLTLKAQTLAQLQEQFGGPQRLQADANHYFPKQISQPQTSANPSATPQTQPAALPAASAPGQFFGSPQQQQQQNASTLLARQQAQMQMQALQAQSRMKTYEQQQQVQGQQQLLATSMPVMLAQMSRGTLPPATPSDVSLLQTNLDPQVFMKALFDVMRKKGRPITGMPHIKDREVDLYNLFNAVMARGGSIKVTTSGQWIQVASQLGWATDADASSPANISLAAEFAGTFQSLLRPFEEVWTQSLRNQQQALFSQRVNAQQAGPSASGGSMAQQLPMSTFTPQMSQMQPPARASPSQNANQTLQPAPSQTDTQQRPTNDPSLEQITEARNVVAQLKTGIDKSRPKVNVINIPAEQKARVVQYTQELVPLVRKVVEILPLYLAMSRDTDTTRKMLLLAAIFSDQLKNVQDGRFALDLSGLEQLRDQLQRCANYVKIHRSNPSQPVKATNVAPAAVPSASTSTQAQGSSSSSSMEQFSMMASKNALKPEDLKPPPARRRPGQTPSAALPSPAFHSPSPRTPQTDAESPPKDGSAKGPTRKMSSARKDAAIKSTPLSSMASPAPQSLLAQADGVLSATRKRTLDEIERDPNEFTERALKTFDPFSNGSLLGQDFSKQSQFSFDPVIPQATSLSASAPSHSFSVLSSGNPFPGDSSESSRRFSTTGVPSAGANGAASAATTSSKQASDAFDINFFIDPTAAGFIDDDEQPSKTPELASPNETSPSSDAEDTSGGGSGGGVNKSSKANAASNDTFGSSALTGDSSSLLGLGSGQQQTSDEFDKWFTAPNEDSAGPPLPPSFNWDGDLSSASGGNWAVFGEA